MLKGTIVSKKYLELVTIISKARIQRYSCELMQFLPKQVAS